MYLKSLELHGFKSFPEKTVLNFNDGATVIVGPNGSGKSNITDAMRWVLGELSSKNIRGSKMEDVIFVGADGRRPMTFAEVSVTFDDSEEPRKLNSPYTEITVTRRYYRGGESEYYINRKPVRLKDINELFMNTGIGRDGYSIIGQGRIAEIISKKNEDRRAIFEETAGISKYRYRKHESEKKLAETESNMTRVRDILIELEARVGPLERAAQKARRYMELFAVKKEADVSLFLWDMAKKREETTALEEALDISKNELEMIEDTERQLDQSGQRLYEASDDNKAAESKLYGEIKSKRDTLHALENEYKLLENNAVHGRERADRDEADAETFKKSAMAEEETRDKFKADVAEAESKLAAFVKDIETLQTERENLRIRRNEAEDKLEELLAVKRELEAQRSDIEVRLGVIESSDKEQKDRGGNLADEIEGYRRESKETETARDNAADSIAEYEEQVSICEADIARLTEEIRSADSAYAETSRRLTTASSECEGLRGRIAALKRIEEHFEGYYNSVKFVMGQAGQTLSGIHAPISQLIRTDAEHAVAIEIAMGTGLQNIVVDDENASKAAMAALKKAGAGRATFSPITTMKGQGRTRELEAASAAQGFVGFADELVRCDEKYRGIISYYLGRIAVFDNIDNATVAARRSGWKIRTVTLDGQQTNTGGSFTGGSVKQGGSFLTRAGQIEKLESELAAAEKKLNTVNAELDSLKSKRDSASSDMSSAEEKCSLLRALMRSEQATLGEAEAKLGVTLSIIEKLERDAENLGESERQRVEERGRLEGERNTLSEKISGIDAERDEVNSGKNDCDTDMEEISERINGLMISSAETRRDIEAARASMEACQSRADEARAKADEYSASAKKLRTDADIAEKLVADKKDLAAKMADEITEMEERRAGLELGGQDYEKKIRELQAKTREIATKKETVYKAHTKNENRYEQLCEQIEKMTTRLKDEYDLTVSEAAELDLPKVTDANRSEVAKTLSETKDQIKALGQVNVDSIDEYAEVKQRYDHVKTQMDDLEASKAELFGIISTIEEEMKRMFVDAFEKINKNFGEVFRELFGGGSAELSLTDPEDVLNCGIEISAAPPGKMIKNLSLLSGGEQAFIAIALLFALIKVNPSPFCIFDEIEAALDEVNVTRVAKYISRVSRELQIIMITHRRGTMEIADTLYGVTMPMQGVSKVFTLDMGSVARNEFIKDHLNS
ncbi:MAG: chromosome segregation protein SMC [Clostridia bacterium]|nr:chromosome segregation protein SMC [Clostridia bacterium]